MSEVPNRSSKKQTTWFIVLSEWQAAQDMSTDATWYPAADIGSSEDGMREHMSLLQRQQQPRRGQITYRNIRGPFPWSEPVV